MTSASLAFRSLNFAPMFALLIRSCDNLVFEG
jgi:hypothetical protein